MVKVDLPISKNRRIASLTPKFRFFLLIGSILFFGACGGDSPISANAVRQHSTAPVILPPRIATQVTPTPRVDPWKGIASRNNIEISPNDILVSREAKTERLLSELVENIRSQKSRKNPELSRCRSDFYFTVTSLVGPYLSLEQESVENCPPESPFGNNAGRTILPITIDLDRRGPFNFKDRDGYLILGKDRVPRLEEMFPTKELIEAVRNLPTVLDQKPQIASEKIETIPELIRSLDGVYLGAKGGGTLNQDSFRAFRFWRVENESVYMQLSLDPAGSRNGSDYLEIPLRIPSSLTEQLKKANLGTEGFLGEVASSTIPFQIEL